MSCLFINSLSHTDTNIITKYNTFKANTAAPNEEEAPSIKEAPNEE